MSEPFSELNQLLAGLNVSIFRLELTALAPMDTPFTAIPLRGAFGYALRNACCQFDTNNCGDCRRSCSCSYAQLFESFPSGISPVSGKFSNAPRPYLLQPEEGAGRSLKAGEEFSINITLIGNAAEHLPSVVAAFAGLGSTEGIGRDHTRFSLARVVQYLPGQEQIIFENGNSTEISPPFAFSMIPGESSVKKACIRFVTPLDLRIKGTALRGAPAFSQLIETLLLRATLLNHLYCGAAWQEPDRRIIEAASSVDIQKASTGNAGFKRSSTRNQHSDRKQGITGSVTYTGNITPFVPLLRLGELIGIGRSTSFGLGRYHLEL